MTYNRRKEDKMEYQLIQMFKTLAAMVATAGVVGGGFFWLGNTKWQGKEEATKCHAIIDEKINKTAIDNTEIKTDLKYIREDLSYIKERVR
jgi:hypothetical protein